jgi:hypothetical protein
MDETQDPKPHPHVHADANAPEAAVAPGRGEALSIWFFCGILTLAYGVVLVATAICEHFQILGLSQPHTVLANLHPTFWWGLCLLLFGLFYTVRFRPGRH